MVLCRVSSSWVWRRELSDMFSPESFNQIFTWVRRLSRLDVEHRHFLTLTLCNKRGCVSRPQNGFRDELVLPAKHPVGCYIFGPSKLGLGSMRVRSFTLGQLSAILPDKLSEGPRGIYALACCSPRTSVAISSGTLCRRRSLPTKQTLQSDVSVYKATREYGQEEEVRLRQIVVKCQAERNGLCHLGFVHGI
jgi:hypothetical protein